MKSSQSVKQLGEDLDAFTWDSPAISSPTARKKKSRSLRRDASAPVLSTTTTTTNVNRVQQNNFMSCSTASASSLQRPMNVTRARSGHTSALYGAKSATKDDSAAKDKTPSLSLPPKVFVPHDTRPGWTPRAVVVRRLQQSYSAMSLTELLTERDAIDLVGLYTELRKNTVGTEDPTTNFDEEPDVHSQQAEDFEFGSTLGTNLIKMLPITMFDDNEFESHPLAMWAAHRATGRALRGMNWCDCVATGVDDDGERLHIEWLEDQTPAIVHRLSVCFDAENPTQFVNRLEHCVKSRRIAESCIRYNLYVDCMPAEELGGLDAEQVNRVLSRAISTNAMRENEFDTSTLLNEINVDYSRTMNKIIFDANMLIPENKHIVETLTLPSIEKKTTKVPEKGVVAVTQYDLEERFKSFVFGTFLVQPEVVYVLERVQQQCNKILGMRLFNTWVPFYCLIVV